MDEDGFGNRIGALDRAAAEGVRDFVGGFLGYRTRIVNVLPVAEAHPDLFWPQLYAGWLMLFGESADSATRALAYVARAAAVCDRADARALANLHLTEALVAGETPRAKAIGAELAARFPTDLAAIKLTQYLHFNDGEAAAMLRVALCALPGNAQSPQLLGMIAFGYEQCHLLRKAESAARAALGLDPNEVWAQHALAHVMLTEGRIVEGRRFLGSVEQGWRELNSFAHTHLWWHRALFDLSLGNEGAVLDAFDSHVWGIDKSYSQDQAGAVSLLARCEFAEIDVGDRWSDLGAHMKARTEDVTQPFLSLSYLYGLTRAGLDEGRRLAEAIARKAALAAPHEHVAWAGVALPAAKGIRAYLGGQMEDAIHHLHLATPQMMAIGGSHAQRDFFAQILLDAHLKAGHDGIAQQLLEERRRFDPLGAPLNRALGDVYERLGLGDDAADARARHY